MRRFVRLIYAIAIFSFFLYGIGNEAKAHTRDIFQGGYSSTAVCNQTNLKLRIDPSAQNSFLTSNVYYGGYDWNGISSGAHISNILMAANNMPYINGYYYVYGVNYSTDSYVLGETLALYNGQLSSNANVDQNWDSITIQMNTNSVVYNGYSNTAEAAKKVFTHEVGHALKLAHPSTNATAAQGHTDNGRPFAIMNMGLPNISYVSSTIQQHDIDNLRAKWGNNGATPTANETTDSQIFFNLNGEKYPVIQTMTDYKLYSDFDSLENDSQLIVIGRFVGDSTQDIYTRYDNFYDKDVIYNGISKNSFEITKILKGNAESKNITIAQRYIVDAEYGKLISFGEMTPMIEGDEWIYFLNDSDNDGVYWPTGNYTGRFPYKKIDKEKLINNEYMPNEIGVFHCQNFLDIYSIYLDTLNRYKIAF